MIPAGYLLKRTNIPPEWLTPRTNLIEEVCSVSDCVNDNIVDVQGAWQHNGFGLANSPDVLDVLVTAQGVDPKGAKLFSTQPMNANLRRTAAFDPASWRPRSPVPSAGVPDDVRRPAADAVTLLGYDVVICNDYLEHSPLSCNSVAEQLPVNRHCLFDSLEAAIAAIDEGAFGGGCEEGTYRVYQVNSVTDGCAPGDSQKSSR